MKTKIKLDVFYKENKVIFKLYLNQFPEGIAYIVKEIILDALHGKAVFQDGFIFIGADKSKEKEAIELIQKLTQSSVNYAQEILELAEKEILEN